MGENLHQLSTDKGLISRIYKELKKLNSRRNNNPINEWANELDSSQKKKYKWPKDTRSHVRPSLVVKEMPYQASLRFHPIPVRLAVIKKTSNNKC
jgi:hypothetical protein